MSNPIDMTDLMLPGIDVTAGILFVAFMLRFLRVGREYEEHLRREYPEVVAERKKGLSSRMVLFPNLPLMRSRGLNPVQENDQDLVSLNRKALYSFFCGVLALTVFPIAGRHLLHWLGWIGKDWFI